MSADHVRWATWDGEGLEHCAIRRSGGDVLSEGTVVGGRGAIPYGACYRVLCDQHWRTREVRLAYAGSFEMHVVADGEGRWFDRARDDAPLPELEGCIDIDIGVTPFTNTLPITSVSDWGKDRARRSVPPTSRCPRRSRGAASCPGRRTSATRV